MVGAIHGRLLTAWSTAGVLGPVLITYIREYQLAHGVARADSYTITMYILCGFLVIALICNAMVKPLADKYFMTDAELAEERRLAHDRAVQNEVGGAVPVNGGTSSPVLVALAWLAVGIPLAWGVMTTLEKAVVLFK
jgi:hypothetical protein